MKASKGILAMCLLLFLCGGASVKAQNNKEIPAKISDQIKSLYPGAQNVNWEMEDSLYEASFVSKQVETTLQWSMDGRLLYTETVVASAKLPGKIKKYLTQHTITAGISEASRIVDMTGKVTYEVEAGNIEYLFDANGQWLSQEKDEEDEDEDEDDEDDDEEDEDDRK